MLLELEKDLSAEIMYYWNGIARSEKEHCCCSMRLMYLSTAPDDEWQQRYIVCNIIAKYRERDTRKALPPNLFLISITRLEYVYFKENVLYYTKLY